MDKIIEKLASVLSPEDLNEVKKAFESAVEERLQSKLDEETKNLAKKADEFCQKKIKEAVEKKTAELEDLANKYCEERCAKITENAQSKIDTQCKKLEEAAQQYIYEYFDEKFQEKYGEELQAIEEKVITSLDTYLETSISEKIDPKLIHKTALTETYAPIIEGIQHLFEEQFVPMDVTGSKKIREAKAETAELQESLKKQIAENMRLAEAVESSKKRAIVAEACAGLSSVQRMKVKKFFENKTLSETKDDIKDYVSVISEQSVSMRNNKKDLFERHSRPVSRSIKNIDDSTDDLISEKKKAPEMTETDKYLLSSTKYLG